jgi:hypothetical protein
MSTMKAENVVGGRSYGLFVAQRRRNWNAIKGALANNEHVKEVKDGADYIQGFLKAKPWTHSPMANAFVIRGGDMLLNNGFFCRLEAPPESVIRHMLSVISAPKSWASDRGYEGVSAERWVKNLYRQIGFPLDRWQPSIFLDGRIMVYYRPLCKSISFTGLRKAVLTTDSLIEAEMGFVVHSLSKSIREAGLKIPFIVHDVGSDTFFYFDSEKSTRLRSFQSISPYRQFSIGPQRFREGLWAIAKSENPHASKFRFCINNGFEQWYLAEIAGDMLLLYELWKAKIRTLSKIMKSLKKQKTTLRKYVDTYARRSFTRNLLTRDILLARRDAGVTLNEVLQCRATLLEKQDLLSKIDERSKDWQNRHLTGMLEVAGITEQGSEFKRLLRRALALSSSVSDYGGNVKDILDSRANEVLYFWTIAGSVATIVAILGLWR